MKSVKASCIQLNTADITSEENYYQTVSRLVEEAASLGSVLVTLPAYTQAILLREFNDLESYLNQDGEIINNRKQEFLEKHIKIAQNHGVYLLPGSFFSFRKEKIYHTSCIISPRGEIILEQDQTHLSKRERDLGLQRGKILETVKTEIGSLGLCVGNDCYYPEVSRILALQEADVILCPNAIEGEYNRWKQFAGMWQEVQQNQTFGLESCLIGELWDVTFDGRTTIYAVCEMTEGEKGILNSMSNDETGFILASLSFDARKRVIEHYPILKHLNRRLYRKMFPLLYKEREAD